MDTELIDAEPKESKDLEIYEPATSWAALFWVLVLSAVVLTIIAFSLMLARSRQIDKIISSRPKPASSRFSTPKDVDFSERGILLVEYGGRASISPEESSEPAAENALPAENSELEASSTEDSEEPLGDLDALETESDPESEPVATLPLAPVPQRPPPRVSSNTPFLVAPPGLPAGSNANTVKPAPQKPASATLKITDVETEGSYQVVSGPFVAGEELDKVEQKFKDKGYTVRQQFLNGSHYLLVDKIQKSQKEALVIADDIARLGYEVTVKKSN